MLMVDNKDVIISKTHISYERIIKCIHNGKWNKIKKLINTRDVLKKYTKGAVEISGSSLSINGTAVTTGFSRRIVSMYKKNIPVDGLVAFINNLDKNPSKTATEELYEFLENNNLPITSDGHFLAYKKVTNDYKDVYTNTIDNSVGEIVTEKRNKVEDNRNIACGAGLHFCSVTYLRHYGCKNDRVVILKINPRDVVSIPVDHGVSKGRCCRYEVYGDYSGKINGSYTDVLDFSKSGDEGNGSNNC